MQAYLAARKPVEEQHSGLKTSITTMALSMANSSAKAQKSPLIQSCLI